MNVLVTPDMIYDIMKFEENNGAEITIIIYHFYNELVKFKFEIIYSQVLQNA